MAYFRCCPYCGANLDPSEICDCDRKEKAASSSANTESGKAKYDSDIISQQRS